MSVTLGVGSMDESEVMNLMKSHRPGVLCLVDGDRPYAVPMGPYFDGKNLYFVTLSAEGQRKMNCIKDNANACFVMYDSLRQTPELIKERIPCRSVIIEGQISLADVKEMDTKELGKVKLQRLKMDIGEIGNWKCPRAFTKSCDPKHVWFITMPDLVADL